MSAGFFAGGGATWGVKIGGFLTSGVKIGGFEGTGNIDTMGGCCFGGAGFGFLGPITAVTLISPPDKALAKSVADEVGTLWLAEMVKKNVKSSPIKMHPKFKTYSEVLQLQLVWVLKVFCSLLKMIWLN